LQHPHRADVAGIHPSPDLVQNGRSERVVDDLAYGSSRVSATPAAPVEPIAERGRPVLRVMVEPDPARRSDLIPHDPVVDSRVADAGREFGTSRDSINCEEGVLVVAVQHLEERDVVDRDRTKRQGRHQNSVPRTWQKRLADSDRGYY